MNYSHDLMLRMAHKYLARAGLKAGEKVLIVCEPPSDMELAGALFEAAHQKGLHRFCRFFLTGESRILMYRPIWERQ
ncbi:hypothetical protein CRH03_21825 [Clostridium sp. HMb25]|nr:hypothetical protein CRH03_21825 [Clostridium sp. HMb25]